jgi:hypothetical protein
MFVVCQILKCRSRVHAGDDVVPAGDVRLTLLLVLVPELVRFLPDLLSRRSESQSSPTAA